VQLGTDMKWRTVLVGGLAGGGQGLYALDVTNPGNPRDNSNGEFSEANAGRLVLWEFTDADDKDLGYVHGKPVIRKMANGRWAAIVSSGYNSREGDSAIGSGKAYLFVIFLDGPGSNGKWDEDQGEYVKIEASITVNGEPVPNHVTKATGLAPPFASDADANGMVDFVYAGDLQGNLWKFDVSAGTGKPTDPLQSALWKERKVILFTARDAEGNPQPITSQAEGMLHRTKPGFMIVFGTGKYLETADMLPTFFTQSYYGVWDKNDNKDIRSQTIVTNRNQLFGYTITPAGNFRVVLPENPSLPRTATPDWETHRGWRMDFFESNINGERAVFRPLLMSGRLIFTTLIPSDAPCSGGGTSFMMIIDPATGAAVNSAVINVTDTDGKVRLDDNDKVALGNATFFASGIKSEVGITPTPVIVKGGPSDTVTGGTGTGDGGTGGNTGGSGTAVSDASIIFGMKSASVAGGGAADSLLALTIMGGSDPGGGMKPQWIGLGASSGRVSWREVLPAQ
jgi:type IV pilus assembly protein PilY1